MYESRSTTSLPIPWCPLFSIQEDRDFPGTHCYSTREVSEKPQEWNLLVTVAVKDDREAKAAFTPRTTPLLRDYLARYGHREAMLFPNVAARNFISNRTALLELHRSSPSCAVTSPPDCGHSSAFQPSS